MKKQNITKQSKSIFLHNKHSFKFKMLEKPDEFFYKLKGSVAKLQAYDIELFLLHSSQTIQ